MSSKKYVVLLRSVNVGGRNPVPKSEFKRILEDMGFENVIVYLNSGNAVFESETNPTSTHIQTSLEKAFGFAIPTLLLPAKVVRDIASKIPADWTNDSPKPDKSGQKSDVLYLFDEINTPDILSKIGYKKDIESMIYTNGAVLTNISRKNQSKGSLQKLIGKDTYKKLTIRNSTTAKKLSDLAN
jgi:uncharacterized protein (DUF1697 family)